MYECVLFLLENMFFCASTGAGKTNCAMLIILYEVGFYCCCDGSVDMFVFKIVYVVLMKVFVVEIVGNLSNCLKIFGI